MRRPCRMPLHLCVPGIGFVVNTRNKYCQVTQPTKENGDSARTRREIFHTKMSWKWLKKLNTAQENFKPLVFRISFKL